MQILGKISLKGSEKEILLKEEDDFFKYYTLELIGVYAPQIARKDIIFKDEENKENMLQLLSEINIFEIIQTMIKNHIDMKIIGEITVKDKKEEVLLKKEGKIFKYFYINLIGVYTPKIPGQSIIFKEDTLENAVSAQIKETEQKNKISPLEKDEIQQFLERIKIVDIIEKLQVQEKGIKNRTKYNKGLEKNQLNKNKENIEIIKKQQINELKERQQQPKKTTNKLGEINIKQEVNMNTRVTDMKNLQQVLQKNNKIPKLKDGDEPLKMGIVESDDLKKLNNPKGEKEQGHSSRYEAVMITKRGKIQALNLENDTQEGTNPLEKNYQVKQNDQVKKGDVLTRLKVGEGTIGIDKGKYGEVEVYHSPRKTIGGKNIEGNKSLDRQLETTNSKNAVEGTNIDTLKLAQEYNDGYRSVEESYQESEKHEDIHPDCEKEEVKDIDGDTNTKSHTHAEEEFVELSNGDKISYKDLASRWGFYKDGKPDAEFVKDKFSKKEQQDSKKPEEVINELDEEFEDPRAPQGRS